MSTPLDDDTVSPGDLIEAIHISQLFPIVEALEDNQTNYREDIGLADAYKVDFSGSGQANEIDAYQAGQQIVFKAAHANTGASTLQIAGPSGDLSAVDLTKFGNNALEAGDIEAGQLVVAIYNDEGSGRFEVIGSAPLAPAPDGDQDGTGFYREDDGTAANAYEVDCSGSGSNPREISALENGMIITFKAAHTNTGASSLDVIGPSGSLGLLSITRQGSALVANDIKVNTLVTVVYNDEGSGRFELLGSQPVAKPQPSDLGDALFREDTGLSTNAYKVTFNSGNLVSSYTDGLVVHFRVRSSGNNTGASTFQVVGPSGSLATKPLTRRNGDDLQADDLIANQMASVIYNGDMDRFELLGGAPSGSGGGGGGSTTFVGSLFSSPGFTLTATTQTDMPWVDEINEGMDHSTSSEWVFAQQSGYYEIGMVLSMEFPSAESMLVEMFKGDHTGWGTFLQDQFDAPAGFCTVSFAPVLVYLEEGEGFKWMLTSANDDPSVLEGTLSTRCSVRLVAPISSSLYCMVGKNSDQDLSTSTQTDLDWNEETLDPGGMHADYSEWLDAPQDGYYEVGLVLGMQMTAAESLIVKLIKDNGSESDYCVHQMDGPSGYNIYNLTPVYIQLNEGDRVKWTVEATLDEPKVLGWPLRSRATMKFLGDL